jgi:hypothetical protein
MESCNGRTVLRPVNISKSQTLENRNPRWLIANLNRLNWSSERDSVYCFSTVFTLLQKQVNNLLFLSYTWLQTGQEYFSSFPLNGRCPSTTFNGGYLFSGSLYSPTLPPHSVKTMIWEDPILMPEIKRWLRDLLHRGSVVEIGERWMVTVPARWPAQDHSLMH